MRVVLVLVIVLFELLFARDRAAAAGQYRFDVWTTEHGLPANRIQALRQTRDGYLWVSTIEGLARFDGVRFQVFTRRNTPILTSDHYAFHVLWEDRQGYLWVGTVDGGAIRYRDGVFTPVTTAQGLPGNTVFRIDEDASGNVWIFTTNGLAVWKDGRLQAADTFPGGPFQPYVIAPKNAGFDGWYCGLWRLAARGWERFAFGRWTVFPVPPHVRDPRALRIKSIVEVPSGAILFSLYDRPDEYYKVQDGALTVFRGVPPGVHVPYQGRDGRLWTGNHDGVTGLWGNGEFTRLEGLSTPYVYHVTEDREGTIWIGTFRGLYRLRRQFITTYPHPRGPEFSETRSVVQDRDGRIWTSSGGVMRLDEDRQGAARFEPFTLSGVSPLEPYRPTNLVRALFEDRDGSLLAGSMGGLLRLRLRDAHLQRASGLADAVRSPVRAIVRDAAGDLWLGSDDGLYRQTGATTSDSGGAADRDHDRGVRRYDVRDGLPDRAITTLFAGRNGTLWVGTDRGLARRDGDRFVPVAGTAPMRVNAMFEDDTGLLWVGTNNHGLITLGTSGAGVLTSVTTDNGLQTNRILQIVDDGEGFLWMGSPLGLQRVRKRDLDEFVAHRLPSVVATLYGQADGLSDPEIVNRGQPAGFRARDGRLWFPSMGGVVVVDPRAVTTNLRPPPVTIEEVRVDRRTVQGMGGAPVSSPVRIAPGDENLEIAYTALSLLRSEQIRFRYILDGVDRDWVDAGTRRVAYYAHVPPGRYTFRVIAANSDGVWNTEGARLLIAVRPPFYRTWWFVTLALGAIAASIAAAWRRRVAQLRRAAAGQRAFAQALITSQEHERKRIASELHDSLGQHLVLINNLALLSMHGQTVDGDGAGQEGGGARETPLGQQLGQISAQASQALGEVKAISYNLRPYQLDRLGLTKAVQAVIKTASAASPIAFSSHIETIDELFPKESEINFYRIVQESVNNIVRHSAATEASLTIGRDDGMLRLTIQDNGRGFAPETAAGESTTGGFGLVGMSERAQLLGGVMSVRSRPGEGATITIEIPL